MRSIMIIICILGLYFVSLVFVGLKLTFTGFSVLLIALATAFLLKKEFYISYINVVNPKYALLYNEKSDSFKKNHRIIDIIGFYLISSILIFIGFTAGDNIFPFQNLLSSQIVTIISSTVLLSIVLWLGSLLILKKSKSNYSFWICFAAMLLSGLLLINLISIFM